MSSVSPYSGSTIATSWSPCWSIICSRRAISSLAFTFASLVFESNTGIDTTPFVVDWPDIHRAQCCQFLLESTEIVRLVLPVNLVCAAVDDALGVKLVAVEPQVIEGLTSEDRTGKCHYLSPVYVSRIVYIGRQCKRFFQ